MPIVRYYVDGGLPLAVKLPPCSVTRGQAMNAVASDFGSPRHALCFEQNGRQLCQDDEEEALEAQTIEFMVRRREPPEEDASNDHWALSETALSLLTAVGDRPLQLVTPMGVSEEVGGTSTPDQSPCGESTPDPVFYRRGSAFDAHLQAADSINQGEAYSAVAAERPIVSDDGESGGGGARTRASAASAHATSPHDGARSDADGTSERAGELSAGGSDGSVRGHSVPAAHADAARPRQAAPPTRPLGPGAVVWARLTGFPWWPAQLRRQHGGGRAGAREFEVIFYGKHDSAMLGAEAVVPFSTHPEWCDVKLRKKHLQARYRAAVAEARAAVGVRSAAAAQTTVL